MLDVETFLARLTKHRYFEGYTEDATAKAIKAIRKRYAEGLAGENHNAFERFPGLSLVVAEIDMEMSGEDDLVLVLRQLGRASFSIFAPRTIELTRHANGEVSGVRFRLGDNKHSFTLEHDSWIPTAFFEEVDKITRQECSSLLFHAVEYPDPGQSGFFLWCTPRAFKALERAKLIPSAAHPLRGKPRAKAARQEEPAKVDLSTLSAPPADTGRIDRLGVFRRGKWRIPTHSEKTLIVWQELAAADTTSAVGSALSQQIDRTFDLLCACDLEYLSWVTRRTMRGKL